jgi:hypothetical protein
MIILIIAAGAAILYLTWPWLRKILVTVIVQLAGINPTFSPKILPTFLKVIVLNWYCILMMFLIWLILFRTDVSSDIITDYLSNLIIFSFGYKALSYFFLFMCIFITSLSIWIIPFFIYSKANVRKNLINPHDFYLSTKLLALVAMLPFLIISNAFLNYSDCLKIYGKATIYIVNIVSPVVFLLITYLFGAPKLMLAKKLNVVRAKIKTRIKNPYQYIVLSILFWVVLLSLTLAKLHFEIKTLAIVVSIFIFISSIIVFRLLFYTDGAGMTTALLVANMFTAGNIKSGKKLYVSLATILLFIIFYYYFVPSLEGTNALYILLIVFSFYIFYFDFWRQIFRNKNRLWQIVALMSTLTFLALPFIPKKHQFRIPFHQSAISVNQKMSLDSALTRRLNWINKDSGSIYIICAMGGGSRAGYITASVLRELDSIDSAIWDHTICYSTVSGGSVGTFTYIKGKEKKVIKNDGYLDFVYNKNYNASGIYGLLIGDGLETLFGKPLAFLKSKLIHDTPSLAYFDRNYRIRKEYDYVLNRYFDRDFDSSYGTRTYYHKSGSPDAFENYFQQRVDSFPIQLINTFEINSGKRTVLSPFSVGNDSFFLNAILPLQDKTFSDTIDKSDIYYREAANLSELFPFVSAASNIGDTCEAQFVDGGYYENYGITTALDIYYHLANTLKVDTTRIKMILIKNSNQDTKDPKEKIQILAPLIGAINSPFTGHANELLQEANRVLGPKRFHVITFDAEAERVPLTRSLNQYHINSMKQWVQQLPKYDSTLVEFLTLQNCTPKCKLNQPLANNKPSH